MQEMSILDSSSFPLSISAVARCREHTIQMRNNS